MSNRYNEYTTNADGQIVIENLPYGTYDLREVSTLNGFMPYEQPILFTLSYDSEENLNITIDVENSKTILMNTGGIGNTVIYAAAISFAGSAIMLLCFYFAKKSKKKTH